ncbi:MAG: single-stranded DNA-binding protein [Deltaproteobacteria bacterium]|nr:MAG: single-stranded DNA-binding protein [Deltaproteobacteria bacterium]
MFYLNRVILAGKLTESPEIRYTPQGKPVIFFTLSLPSEKLEDKSLPFEDVSIRVMLVGERSELWAKQKVKVGENIFVEGGLVQRRWETEEGRMRREIGVIAHKVGDVT